MFDSFLCFSGAGRSGVGQLGGLVGRTVHGVDEGDHRVVGLVEDPPTLLDVVAVEADDERLGLLVTEDVQRAHDAVGDLVAGGDAAEDVHEHRLDLRVAQVMADGLHIILGDPQVKSVFVNVFGGITACDEVANGIVGALDILGDEETKPLVVRLDGNNVDKGRAILDELNHPLVTQVDTMDGAADKAAELAHQA